MKRIISSSSLSPSGWLLGGAVLVVIIALVIPLARHNHDVNSSGTPTPKATGQISQFVGELACLPPKSTNGPATTECAYGLKTGNGNFYALDTILFAGSSYIATLPTGTKVTVSGDLAPKANSTDSQLARYAIQGVIRVADIQEQ